MEGEYFRLTPTERDQAIASPEWAWELVNRVREAEPAADLPPPKARSLTTHKAWQAIEYLLQRANFRSTSAMAMSRWAKISTGVTARS